VWHERGTAATSAVHTEGMETLGQRGRWINYRPGSGGKDHLPPDVRAEVERREALRSAHRGRLLCEVHVQVYENDAVPGVTFPTDAALGVESDPGEIAASVTRARDSLARWR
jgi:hypothetical protein